MRETALLSRRSLAAALPIAAVGSASALALAASPAAYGDVKLLDLGRQLENILWQHDEHQRAFQAMPDAEFKARAADLEVIGDALSRREWEIFEEIMRTPATTIAGLAVKARILAHENDSEGRDEASIATALEEAHYFLDKAAFSLALDIVRLAS